MTRFFHNAVKSPVLTIMLLVLVFMMAFMADDHLPRTGMPTW